MMETALFKSLFFDPQHVGELDCNQPLIACSRSMLSKNKCCVLYLACDKKGIIVKATYQVMGEPYLIAGLEWLCRQLVNTPLSQHPCINYHQLVDALSIPKARVPSAVLIETNYLQAINDLKQQMGRGVSE